VKYGRFMRRGRGARSAGRIKRELEKGNGNFEYMHLPRISSILMIPSELPIGRPNPTANEIGKSEGCKGYSCDDDTQ
jgi:hypothetical protein